MIYIQIDEKYVIDSHIYPSRVIKVRLYDGGSAAMNHNGCKYKKLKM